METKKANFEIISALTNAELLQLAKEYKYMTGHVAPATVDKSKLMNQLFENDHHSDFISKLSYISTLVVYEVFNRFIDGKFREEN